jgi:hypothetical protein
MGEAKNIAAQQVGIAVKHFTEGRFIAGGNSLQQTFLCIIWWGRQGCNLQRKPTSFSWFFAPSGLEIATVPV